MEIFNSNIVQFISFYFCCLYFWCHIQKKKKIIAKPNIIKFYRSRSLIHFELMPFFCMFVSVIPLPCIEKSALSLPEWFGTFVENFWTLYSVQLACMSVFMSVPHCFDYCNFVISFEIRKYETSNFVLFQGCFGYLGPLDITNKFYGGVFYFFKKMPLGF